MSKKKANYLCFNDYFLMYYFGASRLSTLCTFYEINSFLNFSKVITYKNQFFNNFCLTDLAQFLKCFNANNFVLVIVLVIGLFCIF